MKHKDASSTAQESRLTVKETDSIDWSRDTLTLWIDENETILARMDSSSNDPSVDSLRGALNADLAEKRELLNAESAV